MVKGIKSASKKQQNLNEQFLGSFLELDGLCCKRFNVTANDITEYINRLNNAKYAPNREEVLQKLVNYRNIRNRFAHEPWYLRTATELTKEDVQWVTAFTKDFKKEKDPIAAYLAEAKKYAKKHPLKMKKLEKEQKKAAKLAAKKAK